jgi:predicted DsbA family dithiol-disulfide isomerase
LEKLEENYDVTLHWRSFQLRPPGSPPISPQRRAQIEASRPLLQKRAREQYGLEINAGPFGVDSRPALVVAKYAESQGKGNAFHTAAMRAYWQQARVIDDEQVLKEIADSVGLNTRDFTAIVQSPAFSKEVDADIALAHEYGLDGVPALIFANKYLVMGAQPYEVLKQAVEKARADGA